MVSLFTIVSIALTLTASGVFGQCPPNLTGLATSGVSISSSLSEGFIWGSETTPVTAGLAVTGESSLGFAPTFIINPDPVITTTFTIRYSPFAAGYLLRWLIAAGLFSSDVNNTNLLVTNVGNQLFYEPASTTGNNSASVSAFMYHDALSI